MSTKTCSKCGAVKTLSEFYKKPAASDGHCGACKDCTAARQREYYQRNAERIRTLANSRYASNPTPAILRAKSWRLKNPERMDEHRKRWLFDNPEKRAECIKIWNENNPEKVKCHKKLNNAVLKGTVLKSDTCQECGATEIRIEGHHPDYSKPFEVLWLCHSCHAKQHIKERISA